METAEIRRRWLRYFSTRGHTVVPSAPLLYDDPTLLFVNAGMVPFKPYFTGQETPPYRRATSVQKCVRTLDIDEVGKTTRHGTFFQMNGNFSFGDYFKEGAIELAWELVTRPQSDGGYGFDESRLLVSVFHEDDESAQLWKRIAGLPESSSTGGPSSAPTGTSPAPATGTWRSGTWSSCSTSAAPARARRASRSSATCRRRTSTPGWAWSASRSSSRASTTSTRSTRSTRSSRASRS
jgi:hypothetical protein